MFAAPTRFGNLHSGIYHDEWQVQTVGKLAASIATARGFSRKSLRFLSQAALFCNADERRDPLTGECHPFRIPHAYNTLDWMLENKDWICTHYGWTKHNFNMACLLIVRTTYDFSESPCWVGKSFNGKSPIEVAAHFLDLLPAEFRPEAMSFALILNFSNQIANFTGNWKRALASLDGLAREIENSKLGASANAINIERILLGAGSDLKADRALAIRYGITREALLDRDVLIELMPSAVRRRFESNLSGLDKHGLAA